MIKIEDNGTNNIVEICDSCTANPLKQRSVLILGNNNKLIVDSSVQLNDSFIQILGSNCTIKIGKNCRFIAGNLIVNQESNIIIGCNTTWANGVFRAEHNSTINIGNDCMFSADIHIRTSDGHGIFDKASRERINPSSDVNISSHVWLGHGSRINKGVNIGTGTILGQMSLASGVLESFSCYAGVPAKKIKSNVNWSRTQSYDDIPIEYL